MYLKQCMSQLGISISYIIEGLCISMDSYLLSEPFPSKITGSCNFIACSDTG